MRVKILDKFNYMVLPIVEDMIEVDEEILNMISNKEKYCFDVDNNCVIEYDNTEDLRIAKLEELRQRREQECFTIINRGKLWYDTLTEEQIQELNEWYIKWLDSTITLEEPQKPEWLK